MSEAGTAGILLDRDGVLIKNRAEYILGENEVEFIPGSLEAVVNAASVGWPIMIITNQSAIGRGLLSLEVAKSINQLVIRRIEANGGRIDGLYMCPHHPKDGCSCRKPEPGLIQQAAEDFSLDLEQSILIGDAFTDIEAGRRAGVGTRALVRTGRGALQEKHLKVKPAGEYFVFDDLNEALIALLP